MAIYDDRTGYTLLDAQIPFVSGNLPPRLEKRYMNPLRYRTNYRILPAFLALYAVCLVLVIVLGSIDDQKFMPLMIALFALMAVATVWLLLTVPKTRGKELVLERARYDFETECEDTDTLDYEGNLLKFSENGLTVNDTFYWYSHLCPRLVTSNKFNRVWLAIQFGRNPVASVFAPLGPELLHILRKFDIPLENPEMLEYLLSHKNNAFAQIYNTGTFTVFED